MKTFYSAEDIESVAERGQREIVVDENDVLTDLAVHTAQMLGVRIVAKSAGPQKAAPTRERATVAVNAEPTAARPKCCRAGSAQTSGRQLTAPGRSSQPIVEQLVSLVKSMGGR